MVDGSTVEGAVLSTSPESFVLGRPSNYGLKETEIRFAEVELIEAQSAPDVTKTPSKILGIFVMVLGGVYLAFGLFGGVG